MSKSNNKTTYTDILKNTLKTMTPYSESEIDELIKDIPVTQYDKGYVFLHQGDKASCSYYVIQGCVRQLSYDENGREVTINFYIEEEDINTISFSDSNGLSRYSLECLENTDIIICPDSNTDSEDDPIEIANMRRMFFEKQFISMQNSFVDFKLQKPIERFNSIMENRPKLVERVPQNIMANYLGITPESFSRFKKRWLLNQTD